MQTFLPFPSYAASAACLDDKRLNKQIKADRAAWLEWGKENGIAG